MTVSKSSTRPTSRQPRARCCRCSTRSRSPRTTSRPPTSPSLHELGVGEEAIRDAFYVAYLFNIINRMADALRFEVGSQAVFDASAKSLLGRGYR